MKYRLDLIKTYRWQRLMSNPPCPDLAEIYFLRFVDETTPSFSPVDSKFKQLGQYQGAGVLTGFGLRLWHLAHR